MNNSTAPQVPINGTEVVLTCISLLVDECFYVVL